MDALSFSGKTSISQKVMKGKMVIVQVPAGNGGAAAVNIGIDLCGGTEVLYRDGMDGTHDNEGYCYQLQLVREGDGVG